jgi:hypothetical protein
VSDDNGPGWVLPMIAGAIFAALAVVGVCLWLYAHVHEEPPASPPTHVHARAERYA